MCGRHCTTASTGATGSSTPSRSSTTPSRSPVTSVATRTGWPSRTTASSSSATARSPSASRATGRVPRNETMTPDAAEFLGSFRLHVLPKGFVRIHHYGLRTSRSANTKLAAARRLLEPEAPCEPTPPTTANLATQWRERLCGQTGLEFVQYSCCGDRLVRRSARSDELSSTDHTSLARPPPEAARAPRPRRHPSPACPHPFVDTPPPARNAPSDTAPSHASHTLLDEIPMAESHARVSFNPRPTGMHASRDARRPLQVIPCAGQPPSWTGPQQMTPEAKA